jgi:hypothetical protein
VLCCYTGRAASAQRIHQTARAVRSASTGIPACSRACQGLAHDHARCADGSGRKHGAYREGRAARSGRAHGAHRAGRSAPAGTGHHSTYLEGLDPHKQGVAAKGTELLYWPAGQRAAHRPHARAVRSASAGIPSCARACQGLAHDHARCVDGSRWKHGAYREGRATRSGRAHGALGPGRDGAPFYVPGGPGPPQAGSAGQRYRAVILAGRPARSASPACPGSAQRIRRHPGRRTGMPRPSARPCSMRGWIGTEARGVSGGTGYSIGAGARGASGGGALGPGRDGAPFYVPGGPGPPQAGSSGQWY